MKKIISILMVAVLLISTVTLIVSAANNEKASSTATGTISFDVNSAGWEGVATVFCHVWACDGSGTWPSWQAKAEKCVYDATTGIATYDLAKTKQDFTEDAIYACIFSSGDNQTYNLIFGSGCIGDTAYCDGTEYENPADSSKTGLAAFWKNQDATIYGPQKTITSIGNVIGTCTAANTSDNGLIVDFLLNNLESAQLYSGKDDQTLIDDIGNAFNEIKADSIYKEDVISDIEIAKQTAQELETPVEIVLAWDPELSSLPSRGEEPTETEIVPTETEPTETEVVPTETEPTETEVVPTETEPTETEVAPTETEPTETEVVPTETEPTETEVTPTESKPTETEEKEIQLGDANADGMVDVLDATYIQNVLARKIVPNETYSKVANVNNDGFIDILDAARIQKFKARLCNLDGSIPFVE